MASACCATPSSPRADCGDNHLGAVLRHARATVGARRCRGADTCAGRRRGPGQGRHNRRQNAGSVGAQGYLRLDAPLPGNPRDRARRDGYRSGPRCYRTAPSQVVFVSARGSAMQRITAASDTTGFYISMCPLRSKNPSQVMVLQNLTLAGSTIARRVVAGKRAPRTA